MTCWAYRRRERERKEIKPGLAKAQLHKRNLQKRENNSSNIQMTKNNKKKHSNRTNCTCQRWYKRYNLHSKNCLRALFSNILFKLTRIGNYYNQKGISLKIKIYEKQFRFNLHTGKSLTEKFLNYTKRDSQGFQLYCL